MALQGQVHEAKAYNTLTDAEAQEQAPSQV